jgi:DnaK suppressor protein
MAEQTGTIDRVHFQGLLLERRAALLGRIDEDTLAERDVAEATEGPRERLGIGDAGDDATYEVAEDDRLGDAQRATDAVRLIDEALARIADGSYGTCIDCDEPIDERRLEAVPEAARCTACQELEDQRQGAGHHATL